jgi:hypothetical protein
MSRDELTYDENYGAFLASQPPLNLVLIVMVPFSLFMKPTDRRLAVINDHMMMLQYSLFMIWPFALFLTVSTLLIPFSWIFGIIDKIKAIDPKYGIDS